MCEAGRIRHHLKHNLFKRDATILFVGFQAEGTLGRVILDGAERVRIWGEDIVVRAQTRRIDSYSAHADQTDLIAWMEARRPIAGSLFLGHGEAASIDTLRQFASAKGIASSVVVPELGETYHLAAGQPARRTKTGDPHLQEAIGRDWQNSYADFASNLKRELAQIEDTRSRERAVADMRKVLDSYKHARSEQAFRRRGH